MRKWYVIKEIVEYLVAGNDSDNAMENFLNHGSRCREIQHIRSTSGCTGFAIEAEDQLDALTEFHRATQQ